MKNLKIGFSMLVAMFVMSLMTVAFAVSATPTVAPGTGTTTYNTIAGTATVTWTAPALAQRYQVTVTKVSDGTIAVNKVEVPLGTETYTFTVAPDTAYYFSVAAGDDNATYASAKFGPALIVPVISYSGNLITKDGNNAALDTTAGDNNLGNSTGTGNQDIARPDGQHDDGKVGSMNKAVGHDKVHGSYNNNTNSCASCHQTHTAASGNGAGGAGTLLFKASEYEACVACHDGTMTYYNVFSTTHNLGSGTFGGDAAGNMSVHLSDDSVKLEAAPGSNFTLGSNWGADFGCSSCHNPHGSYNTRLLSTDPAGLNKLTRTVTNSTPYGMTFAKVKVIDITSQASVLNAALRSGTNYEFTTAANAATALLGTPAFGVDVNGASNELVIAKYTIQQSDVDPNGYYEKRGVIAGDTVYQFMQKTASKSWRRVPINTTASKTAAWSGYTINGSGTPTTGGSTTTNFDIFDNVKGFLKTKASVTSLDEVQGYTGLQLVNFPLATDGTNMVGGWSVTKDDPTVWYTTNTTIAYSQWCGTCHVDYYGESKTSGASSTQGLAHHTVNSSAAGRSCAFCHFAHGTDVTVMKDATGRDYTQIAAQDFGGNQASAKAWLVDVNPSSALKRYTNMTVCYGCHASVHYGAMGNNGSTGPGAPDGTLSGKW